MRELVKGVVGGVDSGLVGLHRQEGSLLSLKNQPALGGAVSPESVGPRCQSINYRRLENVVNAPSFKIFLRRQ